jgi:peptidoglycan hydrolase CwlO-like protein
MSDITTAELVTKLRENAEWAAANEYEVPICLADDLRLSASHLEQQEQRIAEMETENRKIRQNSVSYTTHAEFVSDYQEQIDERDARIAELEWELAAAKEDIHHNDACSVCIGAEQEVCKDCDCECLTCVLDCRCKDCRDESKWEWRGAREGEGK